MIVTKNSLFEHLKKKKSWKKDEKILLHHDSAYSHVTKMVCDFLQEKRITICVMKQNGCYEWWFVEVGQNYDDFQ